MDISYSQLFKVEDSSNLTRLFQELTGREMLPDSERITSLSEAGGLRFYCALCDGQIVGMTSIVPCRTALYDKYWIEDVAVLSEFREQGIGRTLLTYAMDDTVEKLGPGTFYLTSRPSRVEARRLYASMGFEPYETGVFLKHRLIAFHDD